MPLLIYRLLTYTILLLLYPCGIESQNQWELDGACEPSKGVSGTCQLLKDCQSVYHDMLAGILPKRSCAFFNNNMVVCCPSVSSPTGDSSSNSKDKSTVKSEVGTSCKTEHGISGVHKKLSECPSKLRETSPGVSSSDQSSFDSSMEIVCCTDDGDKKINVRAADLACQEFEKADLSSPTSSCQPGNFFSLGHYVTASGQFPYLAALGFVITHKGTNYDRYLCGGILISTKYILTTAHCTTRSYDLFPTWAEVGPAALGSREAQKIPIDRITNHPKYRDWNYHDDIALISLKTPVKFSACVKPLCLHTQPVLRSHIDAKTSFVRIACDNDNPLELSGNLITTNLNLLPTAECNFTTTDENSHEIIFRINDTTICAERINFAGLRDNCKGYMGGPLLMISDKNLTAVGIFSFNLHPQSPSGYTPIYTYLDWIESIVWPEKLRS